MGFEIEHELRALGFRFGKAHKFLKKICFLRNVFIITSIAFEMKSKIAQFA